MMAGVIGIKRIFHRNPHDYYQAKLQDDIQVIGTPIARVVNEKGQVMKQLTVVNLACNYLIYMYLNVTF